MIINKINEYLSGEGKPVDSVTLHTAGNAVLNTLEKNFGKRREGEARQPSPSSNWACGRRVWFDAQEDVPREPMSARSRHIFALGDTVEALGIAVARQAGVRFDSPDENGVQREFRCSMPGDDSEVMVGHIDASVIGDDDQIYIADWKSMSEYAHGRFEKAAAGDDDGAWMERERWGIVSQVRLYQWLARETGYTGADRSYIVGVRKNTGHMAELAIPVDQKHEAQILKRWAYVSGAIRTGKMPDMPKWFTVVRKNGMNKLPDGTKGPCEEISGPEGWRCSYCPFTEHCTGFKVVPMKPYPAWRKPVSSST